MRSVALGSPLVCRKFDRTQEFYCREFFHCVTCIHVIARIAILASSSTWRTFGKSARGARSLSRASRLRVVVARYSLSDRMLLLLYYSLQTRTRRAVREIDRSRERRAVGSGVFSPRADRTPADEMRERRRETQTVHYKIAFRVGRPRYRFF